MSKLNAIGVDFGTRFFQTASYNDKNEIECKIIRNAFVELADSEGIEDVLKQNSWNNIKDGNKYYVVGEDSLRVAKMFPGKVELRRPLQDGVLNKNEEKKMIVLSHLVDSVVGKAPNDNSWVSTCISSPSVDGANDSDFHKARIMGMLKRLGWNVKVIDEGFAVILSERPSIIDSDGKEAPYSGIRISWGAGRTNCVLAYKGLQILGMSVVRGGDWLDARVAEATDKPLSQCISIKESKLDFTQLDYDNDVVFAYDTYYSELIKYVFNKFGEKFSQVKSQFDAPLDIVVAGGTSMPKGFISKIREVVKELEIPFTIKKIRHSTDPRNSVAKGCLAQAVLSAKKSERDKISGSSEVSKE